MSALRCVFSCLRGITNIRWGQNIDLLKATAQDIQQLLSTGTITSVQLVERCFDQIDKHDTYLHAVLEKNPNAKTQAESLDRERRNGILRGPLHGVPILLKDNIATSIALGMNTTAGSFALLGSRPTKDADVVERIIKAGMIILGKAQLSEFMGFKGSQIMPGWSAVGGQTQSAYTRGDVDLSDTGLGHSSPGGSSTGSAVGISAGYAPLALGTDTGGSLITPSTRAALYTIRPTIGLVSQEGVVPLSKLFDTVGPMSKSTVDLANLMDVLVEPSLVSGNGSYAQALPGDFGQIRIGVLRPEDWLFSHSLQKPAGSAREQMIDDTYLAYNRLRDLAKSFQEVTLISPDELDLDGVSSFYDIQTARFRTTLNAYLLTLESCKVKTLDELISFNGAHSDIELPAGYGNQDQLLAAARANMSEKEHDILLTHARTISRDLGIDKTLKQYSLDVIIGPADSALNLLVSAAGYPSATMPLSYLRYNGRPFGLAAFTSAHGEKTLLKVLSAWEAEWGPRRPPPALEE